MFIQGIKNKLYQISRSPDKPTANVIYVQPLFEAANLNRHVFTRSMIQQYYNGFNAVLYDHMGTGESQGELLSVDFSDWQQDLAQKIEQTRQSNSLPIFLVVFSSGCLLLNDEIVRAVDHIQLWQPEFSGKRLVKQLKRIELLNNHPDDANDSLFIEFSGYEFKKSLLSDIQQVELVISPDTADKFACFDVIDSSDEPKVASRQKYIQALVTRDNYTRIVDKKYWQSSELSVPQNLLDIASRSLLERSSNA